MKLLYFFTVLLILFVSCKNRDARKSTAIDPNAVFYDFKVWAEDESEDVTIMIQYRQGGEGGTTLALENEEKVKFDGTELLIDSAQLTGAFYEIQKRAADFGGKHTISFTDRNGKEHTEEFEFVNFKLKGELPDQIKMEPTVIGLNGIADTGAHIRLVMVDTAFTTKDVNEDLFVKKGELLITPNMWRSLKAGPVAMEIYREQEQHFQYGQREFGRLLITNVIRREFEAIESIK